jgi:hypothetical protein
VIHVLAETWPLTIIAAVCCLIRNGLRPRPATGPHVPADVDLAQLLAETVAIDEASR